MGDCDLGFWGVAEKSMEKQPKQPNSDAETIWANDALIANENVFVSKRFRLCAKNGGVCDQWIHMYQKCLFCKCAGTRTRKRTRNIHDT